MTGWFPFALAALLLMGMQRFFYKVAAERSCDTAVTTLSFMATVTVISAVVFFLRDASVPDLYLPPADRPCQQPGLSPGHGYSH